VADGSQAATAIVLSDDDEWAERICAAIAGQGRTARRVASVAEALRRLHDEPAFVVGVDRAGRELCREIRAQDGGDRTTVYVLASTADELREAVEAGADGCVRLPDAGAAGGTGLELLLGAEVVSKLRSSVPPAASRVLARVCHEMRTSLSGVVGYLDLLAEDPDEVQLSELTAHARRNAKRLSGLVNDLLDLTAFESGDLSLFETPVDLRRVVEEAAEHVEPEVRRRGLTFQLERAPDLPAVVMADERALRRVLDHLLDNAVKFTTTGHVELAIRADAVRGDEILLHVDVRDTGAGIEPEDHARVFDAFWQADPSFTRPHGGMGVGLTVAQRLVAMMGGTVALTSAAGSGSVFRVTLPLRIVPTA
jgi:signal transduction histidine kinase